MRQPGEELVAAVMMHNRLRDDGAERRHAGAEPGWNTTAMERKIGAAGASGHAVLE